MAEARFVGMLDYLAALKRSKLTGDQTKMDALFEACLLDIDNAPPISMEVGTSMLKTLGSSADVPEKWREALENLVQKKVQAGIGEGALKKKESKNQHCENLENYFLQSDWDEMTQNHGIFKKCLTLANRMALLGLLNPNESTSVAVVAIAYVTAHKGPMDELRVNPMNALSTAMAGDKKEKQKSRRDDKKDDRDRGRRGRSRERRSSGRDRRRRDDEESGEDRRRPEKKTRRKEPEPTVTLTPA
eukprot:s5323_g2.t1